MFREPCCEWMKVVLELDREYLAHHETVSSEDRLRYFRKRLETAKRCIHEGHTSSCLEEGDLDRKLRLTKEKDGHLQKCSFCLRYFEGILTELRSKQFRWQVKSALQGLFVFFVFGVYAPYLERKQEKQDRRAAKRLGSTLEEYRSRRYAEMDRKRKREILEAREHLRQEVIGEGTITEECNPRELHWYPHVTEWRLAHVKACNYCKRYAAALSPDQME